jgi:hypothetical protein
MDRHESLGALVRRSRQVVGRDPAAAAALLVRALTEPALYVKTDRQGRGDPAAWHPPRRRARGQRVRRIG